MIDLSHSDNQVGCVENFQDLISTPFQGELNALCWARNLQGDFSEIVSQIALEGNIKEIGQDELLELNLSEEGQIARNILIKDLKALKDYGAEPILNLIKCYNQDEVFPFFPTDVYSFHVDRSPISVDTFLCTYHGDPSEIVANSKAKQKILIPEIRDKLRKLYDGPEDGFDSFLVEQFFDLHYQAEPGSIFTNLGNGHLWRLAIDHPDRQVSPCVHRAPKEKSGEKRLMIIC